MRLLFLLVLTLVVGCAEQPKPHVRSDLSNPKAAALTFLTAISAGDTETARKASVGGDDDHVSIDGLSSLITGLQSYDQAIVKRFGNEAVPTDVQLKQAILELVDDTIRHLASGIVLDQQEIAKIQPAEGKTPLTGRPPIYLRKDKGLWKVDLTATAQVDRRFDPAVARQYLAAGQALHAAARRINAGRYKTLAEAQRDTDAQVQ